MHNLGLFKCKIKGVSLKQESGLPVWAPNQALPSRKQRGRQADGMSVGMLSMASTGFGS